MSISHASTGRSGPYKPTWESLRRLPTPQWLRDGKFGIYTHWGVYAVPAVGPNATWYSHHLYMRPDSSERKHHEAKYGRLAEFGYKDFIPAFTGAKFDADEWAELFERAGARFAGPVAEHHDGFAMWDSKLTEWNAAGMGPKRDVVGELEKAIKRRGMKFATAFHHAENWYFFPVWDGRYDCGDPRYSGLYGPIHEEGAPPNKAFFDLWKAKLVEVVDRYDPDLVWFDFGLGFVHETYKKEFLAHYYNQALARGKEVVVTYKGHNLPPGVGINDLELGQEKDLTYHEWITDSTVDAGHAWGYVEGMGYKTVDNLVDNLVDRVSKNGFLLLNVGPRADGTITAEARGRLLGMGDWLRINGEGIYGTSPWVVSGEGPTELEKAGPFNESNTMRYTSEDIRFTSKGDVLYATVLDWPKEKVLIKSLAHKREIWKVGLYPSEIESVIMLGDGTPLRWSLGAEGLMIEPPARKPCEHAFVFKIVRKDPFGS